MGDDSIEVDLAVDDASVVQSAQVAPQWGQVGGVRSAVSCARVEHFCKGHALGPYDHEGVASPGAAGRHQSGYTHARSLGEQRDETLVLDEVDAAASGGAVPTSVPGHPPQRREQLGIPSVAPVDLDEQRPVSIAPLEQHDPGSLHRCRSEDVDEHAELGESRLDPRLGRQPARRPVHEVDDGGSQRADGEGTNGARRQAACTNSAAISWQPMSHRPKWRNGRLRCGEDVEIAAVATTRAPGGNTGGPSTSRSNSSTLRASSITKEETTAVVNRAMTNDPKMSRARARRPRSMAMPRSTIE